MPYKWTDGTNVKTDMWAPEEPNNKECTQLWYSYMLLDDVNCLDAREYVCEKPAQ